MTFHVQGLRSYGFNQLQTNFKNCQNVAVLNTYRCLILWFPEQFLIYFLLVLQVDKR